MKRSETLASPKRCVKSVALPTVTLAQAVVGGTAPAVFFKMLMIGFFENLPSERPLAGRCEEILLLLTFLDYNLSERTHNSSSLSGIQISLGGEVYQAALEIVLKTYLENNMLKSRHLGLDGWVIEANASLHELQHRNTLEDDWTYVKKLAAEAGIAPDETKAVNTINKKREGRKTCNADWVKPHDHEAEVIRKEGVLCDIVYIHESLTTLDTDAIIRAELGAGESQSHRNICRTINPNGPSIYFSPAANV
jgi:transposase